MTAVLSLPPVPVMRPFAQVHVPRFAADEGFGGFDMAGQFLE